MNTIISRLKVQSENVEEHDAAGINEERVVQY